MTLKPVLCALLAVCGASAQAAAVTWTLTNVTFNDKATASGTITYDAPNHTYLDWDITTTDTVDFSANNSFQRGLHYTYNTLTDASSDHFQNRSAIGVSTSAGNTFFGMVFSTPLTDAGGSVNLLNGLKGSEKNFFNTRLVVTGSVVAAVPEPHTYALMLAGLGMVAFALRRKAKA